MNAPGPVELRRDPDGWLGAWRAGELVAAFVERSGPPHPCFALVARQAPIEPAVLRDVLDALRTHAAPDGVGVALDTTDPLGREFARHHGFTGPLRDPLGPGGTGLPPTDDPVGLRDAVQQLLPGIAVQVEPAPGAARSWLRRAVSGVANLINLSAAPDDGAEPTRFAVPLRGDLLVESIARCIDTTIAIRRRFPRPGASVHSISFDHADFELLHGNHAGSADRNRGLIHMNASFASVEGLTTMEIVRARRAAERTVAPSPPSLVPVHSPTGVPAPFNQIDAVTAHEVWHQMEGEIEARRYLDGLELRRHLGEALGVETLEQAVNGGRPQAPAAWKAAHARLAEEVSPYGASAPLEATAEMFMLWWCSNGARAPIVERFGELAVPLLDRFGG